IVSGLAFGIDMCAHRTALRYGLPTWGVMATGVDTIYPWRHRDDAIRMESQPGCALLSDYPLGTGALAIHFIRRNRIIAALAKATLLVESKEKGGGIITARLAFDYGREVYAVPGRMGDVRSQGCNRLIAGKVAEAVCSPEQWLDSLGFVVHGPGAGRGSSPIGSGGTECVIPGSERVSRSDTELCARMLTLIRTECGITLGQLARQLHCPEVKLASLASVLEADGLIRVDLLRRCRIND
ncbi:MAG: DNA-processing protein DprA, partial [Bacteroidales bacterium]|nr:DNA-processing protein DprA [Bacteroidales bacterium]